MYKHETPIVVLNLSGSGLSVIRSLRRYGISLYAYDIKSRYVIGKTRLAVCGICPNPLTEEAELLQFLCKVGSSFPTKPVLYPCSDDFLHFISRFREALSLYFVFLIPEHSLVETVLDKRLTYELAARYRIPVPKTFIIENANHLEELLPQIPFPCILKPAFGIIFRGKTHLKAIAADNPDDLRKKYLHYSQYSMLMVQELIPGEDHCIVSVKTFYDQEMNLIGMYCNQKLHQFPADLGSACYAVTSNDKEAIEMATSFLQQIHCRGIAGMEFKRDPRDGKLKFMEINARIPLTGALTLNCGVDLAYLYYLSMTGQQPKPVTSQKDGVTWVYLVRMLLTFQVKHKQGKMTYRELARIIFSKKTEAMFTWRDPMPFVRSFISHLKNDWNQKRMSKSSKESVSDAENRNGVCGPPG